MIARMSQDGGSNGHVPAGTANRIDALVAAGRCAEALATLDRIPTDLATRPDGLALFARTLLACGQPARAVGYTTQLVRADPESATHWNLHGRVLNNLRDGAGALAAFRRACELDPQRAESWFFVGHVLRGLGQLADADEALRRSVELEPANARAWQGLAGVAQQRGDNACAVDTLERAVAVHPELPGLRRDLALALHAAGQLDRARAEFDAAIALDPNDAEAHQGLGILCHETRDSAGAERHLQRATALAPGDPAPAAQLAHLYDALNRVDEARQVIAAARKRTPDDPQLCLEAARQRRRAGEIGAAIDLLAPVAQRSLPPRLARQVHHELGRLYDRAGRYDEAWQHFGLCNRIARDSDRAGNASASSFVESIDRLSRFFAARPKLPRFDFAGPTDAVPGFLVGFPRSGTTLTDVMLDSHPGIQSIEERPTINAAEHRVRQMTGGYPEALAGLTQDDIAALRGVYFNASASFVGERSGRLVLDKLPMRTIHVGLVHMLFPTAPIVLALRHPCDVILSNVLQDYALNDMTANFYTVEDAARLYDRVMRLWGIYTDTLPLVTTTIRYEDLVDDRRGQIERILKFLGLDWDPAIDDYLGHVRRRGRIDTTSFDQVSEPVYRRSRLRWLNYRAQLEPVLDVLEPHIRNFGYEI